MPMTSSHWPRVGVVIPVYNDWTRLQGCLLALSRQTYPPECLQVRVVDNGSQDWPEQPGFPLPVEVMRFEPPGSYGARNHAACGWSVDVLAFTDSDCEPAATWLEQGVRELLISQQPWPILAGHIALLARNPAHPSPAELLDQLLGFDQERTVRRAGFGATANLFVPRDVFDALGGFKSRTHSGGDRDFCERARASGISLRYSAHAVVTHPAREWADLLQKQKRIVGGRLSLLGLNGLGKLKVLALSLRPVLSEVIRVSRSPSLSINDRVCLIVLVFRLRGAVLLEWLRLQLPGQHPLR